MGISPVSWFIGGAGVYLMASAYQNVNPKDRLVSILTDKPDPTAPWFPLPDTSAAGIHGKWKDGVNDTGTTPEPGVKTGSSAGGGGNASTTAARDSVVNFGRAQLGERYVFGTQGPNTWDCSGLTRQAYKTVGIDLPHYAASQQTMGTRVTQANARPGDLVFWGAFSGHVGIWLGGNQVLHAPKTGDVVKISPLWNVSQANFRSYLP